MCCADERKGFGSNVLNSCLEQNIKIINKFRNVKLGLPYIGRACCWEPSQGTSFPSFLTLWPLKNPKPWPGNKCERGHEALQSEVFVGPSSRPGHYILVWCAPVLAVLAVLYILLPLLVLYLFYLYWYCYFSLCHNYLYLFWFSWYCCISSQSIVNLLPLFLSSD